LTSPVSARTSCDAPVERRVGTVGRVHPHLEVKIVDGDGQIAPRRTPGEYARLFGKARPRRDAAGAPFFNRSRSRGIGGVAAGMSATRPSRGIPIAVMIRIASGA